MDIVSHTAEMSMQVAVEEVKALPHYESDGEVQMYIACVRFSRLGMWNICLSVYIFL